MYGYFKGVIESINENGMVIEVNNIGYNILMPMGKCYDLGAVGDSIKVYTYTNVREDAINLFGFVTKEELELFKMLISVSGVGPKSGQELVNTFSVDELENAIVMEDAARISKAPGIGKKSAERIIIDLKDKIAKRKETIDLTGPSINMTKASKDIEEAIEALMALGYSKKESADAINKAVAMGAVTSEEMLKGALKNL